MADDREPSCCRGLFISLVFHLTRYLRMSAFVGAKLDEFRQSLEGKIVSLRSLSPSSPLPRSLPAALTTGLCWTG
jgi:hypothetical protein